MHPGKHRGRCRLLLALSLGALSLSARPAAARFDGYPSVDNETWGLFNAVRDGLAGPADEFATRYWSSEQFEQSLGGMLGLARYLSAGTAWATALLAEHLPAYPGPFVDALRRAVEKMLQQRAWQDWLTHYGDDPLDHDNLMYRGYLFFAMGLYQRLSGDPRYAQDVVLRHADGRTFSTSFKRLAESLAGESAAAVDAQGQHHHGIACEPGQVFVICNTQPHVGFTLYDQLYGTSYAARTPPWLDWIKQHMLEPQSGLFYQMYRPQAAQGSQLVEGVSGLFNSVALLFVDAFDDAWEDELYARFLKTHVLRDKDSPHGPGTAVGKDGVYDEGGLNELALGIATTGSALALVRAHGDESLYAELLAGWRAYIGDPGWNATRDRFSYSFPALVPLMLQNGMPLLARAITPAYTPAALLRRGPPPKTPRLEPVGDPRVFVNQAVYDADQRALLLTINGGAATHDPATLVVAGLDAERAYRVEREGAAYTVWERDGTTLRITTPPLSASEESYAIVQTAAEGCGCAADPARAGGGALIVLLGCLLAALRRATRRGLR